MNAIAPISNNAFSEKQSLSLQEKTITTIGSEAITYLDATFDRLEVELISKPVDASAEILAVLMPSEQAALVELAREFGREVMAHPDARHPDQLFTLNMRMLQPGETAPVALNGNSITRVVALSPKAETGICGNVSAANSDEIHDHLSAAQQRVLFFTAAPSFLRELMDVEKKSEALKATQVQALDRIIIEMMAASMTSMEAQTGLKGVLGNIRSNIQAFRSAKNRSEELAASIDIRENSVKLASALRAIVSNPNASAAVKMQMATRLNQIRATDILPEKAAPQIVMTPKAAIVASANSAATPLVAAQAAHPTTQQVANDFKPATAISAPAFAAAQASSPQVQTPVQTQNVTAAASAQPAPVALATAAPASVPIATTTTSFESAIVPAAAAAIMPISLPANDIKPIAAAFAAVAPQAEIRLAEAAPQIQQPQQQAPVQQQTAAPAVVQPAATNPAQPAAEQPKLAKPEAPIVKPANPDSHQVGGGEGPTEVFRKPEIVSPKDTYIDPWKQENHKSIGGGITSTDLRTDKWSPTDFGRKSDTISPSWKSNPVVVPFENKVPNNPIVAPPPEKKPIEQKFQEAASACGKPGGCGACKLCRPSSPTSALNFG